ncbi:hypothetical protein O181_033996 [Austropuccinia psidii MF-1]|uniref:Integrase catalytic domain-containing protein n=1 Tax=Austropuccinia psidii MF-1 TaxID=1389203 RepID=A0A9Q3CZU1_9BASI|nr:hypothetical protein [Austropuccinia psidii MF-1]
MVGDVRALNTYTIPDRYPIPWIHETLTQLSQAKLIKAMDSLKEFYPNVLTANAKRLLWIIAHCGIYEYSKKPFCIKNAPSHYQRMMNTIFPEELSEGWLITNINDIIACSETWETWVPQEEHHIEGICVTDIRTEFFNQVEESYEMDKNFHILFQLLMKDYKDPSLSSKLDELWKKAYDAGIFHLLDGILYHRTKHTCVITLTYITLINTISNECHDSVASGHLSEDRTLERVKTCSWWPNWRNNVVEYCQTCDRFQEANRATVLVNRYRQPPIFLPCHDDDTAMDTAIMIWNKAISRTGLFQNIISDTEPKFTSALWTNLHNFFGAKLLFSTAYHPQTDGLAEIMIQILEEIIRRFCTYGL